MAAAAPSKPDGMRPVWGVEDVNISSTDYVPTHASGCSRKILIDNASAATIVKVDFADGTTSTVDISKGVWHEMAVTKVYKVGTTATGIHLGF